MSKIEIEIESESKNLQIEVKKNLNKFQMFFYEYGRYYFNFINILIHIIFVPIITLSFDRMVGILGERNGFASNPFFILYGFITFLYLYIDSRSGLITAIEFPLIGYLLKFIKFEIFGLSEIQSYLLVNIISCIAEFLSHRFAEKRKRAVLGRQPLAT